MASQMSRRTAINDLDLIREAAQRDDGLADGSSAGCKGEDGEGSEREPEEHDWAEVSGWAERHPPGPAVLGRCAPQLHLSLLLSTQHPRRSPWRETIAVAPFP